MLDKEFTDVRKRFTTNGIPDIPILGIHRETSSSENSGFLVTEDCFPDRCFKNTMNFRTQTLAAFNCTERVERSNAPCFLPCFGSFHSLNKKMEVKNSLRNEWMKKIMRRQLFWPLILIALMVVPFCRHQWERGVNEIIWRENIAKIRCFQSHYKIAYQRLLGALLDKFPCKSYAAHSFLVGGRFAGNARPQK